MKKFTLVMILITFLFVNFLAAGSSPASRGGENNPESVIIIWTDGPRLKALNIVFFTNNKGPIGIVSVPNHTWMTDDHDILTIVDFYEKYGRQKLVREMEKLFQTSIDTFIAVDQKALSDISQAIGTIEMNNRSTTLMDIFEGKYTDGPVNLQVEIRELADAMITPALLFRIPQAAWILTKQVESNIGAGHVMTYYQLIYYRGPEILRKKAVPGNDLIINNRKYRRVNPDSWSQTMKEVTS